MAQENGNSQLFLVERRREERRTQVHASVEVTLHPGDANAYTERTFIEDVSDFGCRFSTRAAVQQGDTVSMRLLASAGKKDPNEKPRLYKIMWVAENGRTFTAGARLIKGEKLMDVDSLPVQTTPPETSK